MQMYLKQKELLQKKLQLKQRLAEHRKEYESLEADIKTKSKWHSFNYIVY